MAAVSPSSQRLRANVVGHPVDEFLETVTNFVLSLPPS